MSADDFDIRVETWGSESAIALREAMDAELRPRYADRHREHPPRRVPIDETDILFTLIAYDGTTPAGTVSLKRTGRYAEVKRVVVDPRFRRRGLAARLLSAAEDEARVRGIDELVLQTGSRQPEAIALYQREGWHAIAPFGPYREDPGLSRCFAKAISPLLTGVHG